MGGGNVMLFSALIFTQIKAYCMYMRVCIYKVQCIYIHVYTSIYYMYRCTYIFLVLSFVHCGVL